LPNRSFSDKCDIPKHVELLRGI